jgi:hypothetical protein
MRLLRYSINVTLDGCCDHREGVPDEELHRHAADNLAPADALLFGRVTYQMMEAAFRPVWTGERPDWMEPFRRTIDAAKKYVVSSTLERVDWNAKLVRGDLGRAVQRRSLRHNHRDEEAKRRCPQITGAISTDSEEDKKICVICEICGWKTPGGADID